MAKQAWGPGNSLWEWKKKHGRGAKRSRRGKSAGGAMAKKGRHYFGGSKKGGLNVAALLMRGASSVAGPSRKGNELAETGVAALSGIGAVSVVRMATGGSQYIPMQDEIVGFIGGGVPGAVAVIAAKNIPSLLKKATGGVSSGSASGVASSYLC